MGKAGVYPTRAFPESSGLPIGLHHDVASTGAHAGERRDALLGFVGAWPWNVAASPCADREELDDPQPRLANFAVQRPPRMRSTTPCVPAITLDRNARSLFDSIIDQPLGLSGSFFER